MTDRESFKRRVRDRMAKTGEKYNAARRVLIEHATSPQRIWQSSPEIDDDTLHRATARHWNEWCDLIDAAAVHEHKAVAAWLMSAHALDGWWAQTVTVGWERITGRRVRHQRSDGTYEAGKTMTVQVDASELRSMLLEAEERGALFPGFETALRSKPSSKSIRIGIGPGTALFSMTPRPDGRVSVNVAHSGLPDTASVEEWKHYWAQWLSAVDAASTLDG